MGKQVKGSWPRQKRGEAIIDKLNEEMSNWKDLRRSAQSNEMTAEIPSEATRVANLMAMPESKSTVRQVERALSKHKPDPIPIERVTYKQVITLLVKHDEIKEAKYWLEDSDETNERDSRDTRDKSKDRHGDDKNGSNNLSRKEKRARHNYARTKRKKWSEVTMEMINNDGGIQHWADRNTNSIDISAHPGAPAEAEDDYRAKIECKFHKMCLYERPLKQVDFID